MDEQKEFSCLAWISIRNESVKGKYTVFSRGCRLFFIASSLFLLIWQDIISTHEYVVVPWRMKRSVPDPTNAEPNRLIFAAKRTNTIDPLNNLALQRHCSEELER